MTDQVLNHEEFVGVLKALGFASEQEWSRMMAAVDLTDAFIALKFEAWKHNDGSKAGLQTLVDMSKAVKEVAPVVELPKPVPRARPLPECPLCKAGFPTKETHYSRAIKERADVVIEIRGSHFGTKRN